MYLKIESLLGRKLDQYKTEEYQVLVFNERVQEAQRIAQQEIKNIMEKKTNPLKDLDEEGEQRHSSKDHGKGGKKFDKKGGKNNSSQGLNSRNIKKMKIDI